MTVESILAPLLGSVAVAVESGRTLSAYTWAQPRDGCSVARMSPLPEVVEAWLRAPEQHLVDRYPSGEGGLLWTHELRSWLTALGMPTRDQQLVPGGGQADRIKIELASR
jgi:hypothetical protein